MRSNRGVRAAIVRAASVRAAAAVVTGSTGRTFLAEPVLYQPRSDIFCDFYLHRKGGHVDCGVDRKALARNSADASFPPYGLARRTGFSIRQGRLYVSS